MSEEDDAEADASDSLVVDEAVELVSLADAVAEDSPPEDLPVIMGDDSDAVELGFELVPVGTAVEVLLLLDIAEATPLTPQRMRHLTLSEAIPTYHQTQ